eukprot:g6067.t1
MSGSVDDVDVESPSASLRILGNDRRSSSELSVEEEAVRNKTMPLALYQPFFLGQTIALLVGGTGFFSELLVLNSVSAPTLQNSANYLILSFFLPYLFYIRGHVNLQVSWWKYAFLALVDVEANYIIVKAYQYTSVTSVMLLDCTTIPVCMILSRLLLDAKYKYIHIAGLILCSFGIVTLVYGDLHKMTSQSSKCQNGDPEAIPQNALIGDIMCIVGAILYAMSNVGQEILVKSIDRREYLGMIGVFGVFISIFQSLLLEEKNVDSVSWDFRKLSFMAGYVFCLSAMYILTSFFLQVADSAFFNMSLLTSDLWAVVTSFLLCGIFPQKSYYLALVLIVLGVYTYSTEKVETRKRGHEEDENGPIFTSI